MDKTFLEKILNTYSVSGFEDQARKQFINYLTPFVDYIDTEYMGNCYTYIGSDCKNDKSASVLIEAHIDEIGFQVQHINSNGLINIIPIGGLDKKVLAGQVVEIYKRNGRY